MGGIPSDDWPPGPEPKEAVHAWDIRGTHASFEHVAPHLRRSEQISPASAAMGVPSSQILLRRSEVAVVRARSAGVLAVLLMLLCAVITFAEDWGVIRYVHSRTNIRAARSTKSKIVGKLEAGQKVRADFLKDNWYAIFGLDDEVRDEQQALGYVYAPLLKPNPPEKARVSKAKSGILKHRVVAREDVSYRGCARMVFRVVVEVNRIPPKDQLKTTAIAIWKAGNQGWDEFYVYMYLPDMDTRDLAYGVGEFTPNGLKDFRIQDFALYGTRWEG